MPATAKIDTFFKAFGAIRVIHTDPTEFGVDDDMLSFSMIGGFVGISEHPDGRVVVWKCTTSGGWYEPPSEEWDIDQEFQPLRRHEETLFQALKRVVEIILEDSLYFALVPDGDDIHAVQ